MISPSIGSKIKLIFILLLAFLRRFIESKKINFRHSPLIKLSSSFSHLLPFPLGTLLVNYLEENRIQTRNYFAGNILLHPGYSDLDSWGDYENSNQVLDRVFFIGAAPHYNHSVFNYVEEVVKRF